MVVPFDCLCICMILLLPPCVTSLITRPNADAIHAINLPSHVRCTTSFDDTSNGSPCAARILSWPGAPPHTQDRTDAETELYQYLRSNLMPFDLPNAVSLGFGGEGLPDGLSDGIVGPTIRIALDAKQYPWTRHVPKDVYFEHVGSFTSVNEPRNNWRPLFHETLLDIVQPLIEKDASAERVARALNQNMWDKFGSPIEFRSGQTPLVYDPMSVIAFGYASCTGTSIFLIDALRAFGIPARLAGTPAWNGRLENGNHSWVEFYGSDGGWHVMEGKPASLGDDRDLWDPCQWWFCNAERTEGTSFFAARLDRTLGDGVFPLAWDPGNDGVIGENRTDFMIDLCSRC